jgi:choice-of-anchor A domain-containing protein
LALKAGWGYSGYRGGIGVLVAICNIYSGTKMPNVKKCNALVSKNMFTQKIITLIVPFMKTKFLHFFILFFLAGKVAAQINVLSDCAAGAAPGCPVPFPFPPQTWPDINGRDNAFNFFIGGNFVVKQGAAEIEGKSFVMGNFNVQKTSGSFSLGFVGAGSWVVPDNGTDVMIVGGNSSTAGANVHFGGFFGPPGAETNVVGNFRYKGNLTGSKFFANDLPGGLDGQIIADPGLNLLPYQNKLNSLAIKCDDYASLPTTVNSVYSNDGFGNYTFKSTNGATGLYVFNINTNINPGFPAALIFDNFPDDAEIVINMTKSGNLTLNINSIDFSNIKGNSDKLMERLLWNFPNANRVNLTGFAQFRGAVLSKAANNYIDISTNGRFVTTGDVIVGNSSVGVEIHNYPFRGQAPFFTILPVKLESFSGNISGNKALLAWKTQNEYDIKHYEIEMSNNGRNFKSIGIINKYVASGGIYSFNYNLGNEKNYYFRLKLIDKSNSFIYSNVIVLKTVEDNNFSVNTSSNLTGKNKLTVYLPYGEKASAVIYDSFGRIIKQDFSLVNSTNDISVKYLSGGIYFIRITSKTGEAVTKRFVIQ